MLLRTRALTSRERVLDGGMTDKKVMDREMLDGVVRAKRRLTEEEGNTNGLQIEKKRTVEQ